MSVRLKRLTADFESIGRAFTDHPHIRILEVEGDPPERYKVEFHLKGLVIQDSRVVPKSTHLAEIYLPLGYPRQAPQCRMLSPIYHPNIAPHAICIGDHWSAGESLASLISRIGEIITFQSYNIKSPLNGEAARWAEQNMAKLPLQKVDLTGRTGDRRPGPGPSEPSALPL
ncbi:MAG TPA: ubiquitin-conjugating enzyme E2 [Planctomycetota bacterium]|nr:ubiquitin-conjugating enzyme E2 [Planctomycetota bacterium]